MVRYHHSATTIALAIVSSLYQNAVSAPVDTSNCEPIVDLGIDNLDRYDYSANMKINDNCGYTLDIKFKHDESLPIPSSGSQCDPSTVPPDIASDGMPYLAFRWAYKSVPNHIKDATGIDHISLDFNPCGHPPMDTFTIPHYDLHIYLESPEYRTCMTCDKITGAPICNPEGQSTPNGQGFFNVGMVAGGLNAGKLSNMPAGFEYAVGDNVPLMGGHSWDFNQQPNASNPWVDPIWIMGTYDGKIVDYEPMIPLSFIVGGDDTSYEESLTYVGQTIKELPTKYKVDYDSESGFVTLRFEGNSNICDEGVKTKKSKAKKSKKSV